MLLSLPGFQQLEKNIRNAVPECKHKEKSSDQKSKTILFIEIQQRRRVSLQN